MRASRSMARIDGGTNRISRMIFAVDNGMKPGEDCFKTRLAQEQLLRIGARRCLVKVDKVITFLDTVTFSDQQLLDNSAFQMLNDLVLACGYKAARRDDCSCKLCGCSPRAEAAKADEDQHDPEFCIGPD